MPSISKIFTIGYEGKKIDEFLTQLKTNKVDLLIDARIHPGGRKLDFCKNYLRDHLFKAGINYAHYKELGTPKFLMEVMKRDGHYSMDEYAQYLEANSGILDEVVEKTENQNIAIMCFEKNYLDCHRSIVAEKLSKKTMSPVFHL